MWTLFSLVLWWKWNVIGPFNLTSTMLILKVNPKCANSGHFKLTIDGLLGAITQTMEVGWGDWRMCAGSAKLAEADQWYHHYHKAQYLNVIIVIPIWIRGWPVASVWQAASPYRPASKHRRLQIISAAEIQLAYLSISVWNRRYGGPMSYVTTIFLQLNVTLWFLSFHWNVKCGWEM